MKDHRRKRKMYLDVDGVLVTWDEHNSCVELARGFGYLMRFCKLHDIQPYWLSMWCRNPAALHGLNCLLWPQTCTTMAIPEVVPHDGRTKSERIDFTSDFVWIEDGLPDEDVKRLKQHNALHRFFWTDGRDPDCLYRFIGFTCEVMGIENSIEFKESFTPALFKPKHPDMT